MEAKKWGRIGAAAAILGVDRQVVPRIASAAGIPVREIPGCKHRLFDLDAVRQVAEQSTRVTRLTPKAVGV
ncbi:MAG: hypothetical protein ACLQU5_27055 [Isosphaeraceae bacterium]